jgi:hypothetical protein
LQIVGWDEKNIGFTTKNQGMPISMGETKGVQTENGANFFQGIRAIRPRKM